MDATIFWDLLEQACEMGKFVAAVPNSAASANIVGKLRLGKDGDERVLQKKKHPECHVHFRPEQIAEFAFVYLNTGFGTEPCLEVRSTAGVPVLRLYYQGKKVERRYDEFMRNNSPHEALITGSWSQSGDADGVAPFNVEAVRDNAAPEAAKATADAGDAATDAAHDEHVE